MSLELLRNWMRTLYTNVYWPSVCTSIILCCLSMSSTLGTSSTWWRETVMKTASERKHHTKAVVLTEIHPRDRQAASIYLSAFGDNLRSDLV